MIIFEAPMEAAITLASETSGVDPVDTVLVVNPDNDAVRVAHHILLLSPSVSRTHRAAER